MLLEKLTNHEKEMMSHYISAYGRLNDADGPSHRRADIDYILRIWDANKRDLFKLFGGELIVSKDIEIPLDVDDVKRKIGEAMDYPGEMYTFRRSFLNAISSEPTLIPVRYSLMELITTDALAENKMDYNSFSFTGKDGKLFKVNCGCKPIKTLGKIATMYNIDGFEEFRLKHSMLLNQKHLHGNLCLSIHPLDYMTMSDNACNWESCMSWKNSGCYRRGTVEMMNSPVAIVAYLTAEEEMSLETGYRDETWNSKKWRELFIVNKDVISEVKGYPYQSVSLVDAVLAFLRDLAKKNWDHEYDYDSIYLNDCGSVKLRDGNRATFAFWTETMYNDFGTMDRSHHMLVNTARVMNQLNAHDEYSLCYSGESECMWCGSISNSFDCEEALYCEDCGEYYTCSCCGAHFHREDDLFWVDDEGYCEECYAERFNQNQFNYDEPIAVEDSRTVYLRRTNDDTPEAMNEADYGYRSIICDLDGDYPYRAKNFLIDGYDSIKSKEVAPDTTVYWVDREDLTDSGFRAFGLWDENDQDNYFRPIEETHLWF